MQGAIFAKILQMSLIGSYSIGVVLAVRLLLIRWGRCYAYQLWLLMFVSLCLPFSLPGNYSLIPESVAAFSLSDGMVREESAETGTAQKTELPDADDCLKEPAVLHRLSPEGVSTGQLRRVPDEMESAWQDIVPAAEGTESAGGAFVPAGESDREKRPEGTEQIRQASGQELTARLALAERIWFLGLLILILYHLFAVHCMYRRCSGYGQPERKEDGWIVEAERVPSPFLWGILRPVIYLPAGLEGEERAYILAHEKAHRNRGDHLVRLWLLAVAAVHWFNPLVWISYALCCRDMEISCDEAVLRSSGTGIQRSYAESLLKCAASQNRFLISPPGFGEPSVKSRIKNVLHFRKRSVWISLAAGLCVAGVAAGLLHYPAGDEALPEPPVQEAEPQRESEAPAADETEGLVANNGGEVLRVAGEYYYMDGMPLYSDGEALYASVQDDDGTWHVCRYEPDGSGFKWILDGRIADSTADGKILYCMLGASDQDPGYPGRYDTQTEESRRLSQERAVWLNRSGGFLYLSRLDTDGLHFDRIRETDWSEETDLLGEGFPGREVIKFHADEEKGYLVFAVRTDPEEAGNSGVICGSYNMGSGQIFRKELTGLTYFAMMDGYLYFQRYRSREDHTPELFRTDYEFTEEEQIGEGLTLLCTEEETHTLLAEKKADNTDFEAVSSLVRVLPDEKKEQMLLDMEAMLPKVGGEERVNDVWLDWEFQSGDGVAYSELNLFRDQIYVTVSHLSGQRDEGAVWEKLSLENALEEVHLTINARGGIGIWFPDELTPGWEDDSWYTEPMVGIPMGMKADGWDLQNVTDVREDFQNLPEKPNASERGRTYLLGETEYWTLYGKGDYKSMLLARNGRYTKISYPYRSSRPMCPELMEADLDHDGITELAVRFNVRHGTGCSIDTLLLADFQNNGAWVYQFTEEDMTEQLMAHITGERAEQGLQAYIDGKPAGMPVEDEREGRTFRTVSAGQLIAFSFEEADEKIRIRAELEFWDRDFPASAEYNGCSITADVVWEEDHFELRNTGCQGL